MSYLNNILSAIKKTSPKTKALAGTPDDSQKKRRLPTTYQATFRTRQDISNWNMALDMYNATESRTYPFQLLLDEIELDAHITSQIQNRKQQLFIADFTLKNAKGEVDEVQTLLLKSSGAFRAITDAVLDSIYRGYTVLELDMDKVNDGNLAVHVVPRTNIVPRLGLFFKDYFDDSTRVKYRELPEYGTYILEFDRKDKGLLNKAVPHVLFKRFAESCHSELCEIYGIPPRYMKTDTTDPAALRRAEKMMEEMGAAAWFIIDDTEEFDFADGISTSGDVYTNLMSFCDAQNSLLLSGAIIGQDTKKGSYNKDQSAQQMLEYLVAADMEMVETDWNKTIIPALLKIGFLKGDIRLEFQQAEDIDQLFKFTQGFMLSGKQVDDAWIKEKFGVEVTGDKSTGTDPNKDKNLHADFFV